MNVKRGDVVLVPIRFTSGSGIKTRPVLVVQSDHNNQRLNDTIVAIITSTTHRATREATQVLVDPKAPDGISSGILHVSAITCERLHTVERASIRRKIGELSPQLMQLTNGSLKTALDLQ